MTKKDFVRNCVNKLEGVTITDMTLYYDIFCETIAEAVGSGESLKLPGVGTLSHTIKAARDYKSPIAGTTVHVPEHRAPKFSASQTLKEALRK